MSCDKFPFCIQTCWYLTAKPIINTPPYFKVIVPFSISWVKLIVPFLFQDINQRTKTNNKNQLYHSPLIRLKIKMILSKFVLSTNKKIQTSPLHYIIKISAYNGSFTTSRCVIMAYFPVYARKQLDNYASNTLIYCGPIYLKLPKYADAKSSYRKIACLVTTIKEIISLSKSHIDLKNASGWKSLALDLKNGEHERSDQYFLGFLWSATVL